MKVLVVGAGGREHAIAWALRRAASVSEVVVAPGNDGMVDVARVVGGGSDIDALVAVATRERPDLVVVGPEAPLTLGLADRLRAEGFDVFGPGAAGARLEGSKSYAKAFMERHGVPTAGFAAFTDLAAAREHLDRVGAPIVVKDSRLAAGKGVTVATDLETAHAALGAVFESPDAEVVLEERLHGDEISVLLFVADDGYSLMPASRDYKRVGDGDVGPMTGGMGAVAPLPLTEAEHDTLVRTVVEPVVAGLRADGIDYRGVLYIGVMRTADGYRVLEFNVRFGDPECQPVLMRLKSDLVETMLAVCEHRLDEITLEWDPRPAVCVVMSSGGYPGAFAKGYEITGIEQAEAISEDVKVFHAGTAMQNGKLVNTGGRVLGVTALGSTVAKARELAYAAVEKIHWQDCYFRKDIAVRAMQA